MHERSAADLLPDDPPAAEARQCGRAAFVGADDLQSLVGFHHGDDADVGAGRIAASDQFGHETGDAVDRDRKAEACTWPDLVAIATFMPISRPLVSSSGPPELPGFKAASVWMIDLQLAARHLAGQVRLRAGDDAGGDRAFEAERVAEGVDPLADAEVVGGHRVRSGRARPVDRRSCRMRDVVFVVVADHAASHCLPSAKVTSIFLASSDHMEIGEDVALAVDHRHGAGTFARRNAPESRTIGRSSRTGC